MDERTYFVLCADNCKFEGMTKEQILTAISEAVSTGEIKDVDTGFVTTVKEQNSGAGVKFWFGTSAQYNAIAEKESNCFYVLTDDTTKSDIESAIINLQKANEAMQSNIGRLLSRPEAGRVLFDDTTDPIVTGSEDRTIAGLNGYNMIFVTNANNTFSAVLTNLYGNNNYYGIGSVRTVEDGSGSIENTGVITVTLGTDGEDVLTSAYIESKLSGVADLSTGEKITRIIGIC